MLLPPYNVLQTQDDYSWKKYICEKLALVLGALRTSAYLFDYTLGQSSLVSCHPLRRITMKITERCQPENWLLRNGSTGLRESNNAYQFPLITAAEYVKAVKQLNPQLAH